MGSTVASLFPSDFSSPLVRIGHPLCTTTCDGTLESRRAGSHIPEPTGDSGRPRGWAHECRPAPRPYPRGPAQIFPSGAGESLSRTACGAADRPLEGHQPARPPLSQSGALGSAWTAQRSASTDSAGSSTPLGSLAPTTPRHHGECLWSSTALPSGIRAAGVVAQLNEPVGDRKLVIKISLQGEAVRAARAAPWSGGLGIGNQGAQPVESKSRFSGR